MVTIRTVPKGTPQSGQLLIRLAPELLQKVKALAAQEKRSATSQVAYMLEQWLEQHATKEKDRR